MCVIDSINNLLADLRDVKNALAIRRLPLPERMRLHDHLIVHRGQSKYLAMIDKYSIYPDMTLIELKHKLLFQIQLRLNLCTKYKKA